MSIWIFHNFNVEKNMVETFNLICGMIVENG